MMFNYIIIFLWGVAIGTNFMAWWKDRNWKKEQEAVKKDVDNHNPKEPIMHGYDRRKS